MNYEERIRIVAFRINEFLKRYRRPEHLDDQMAMEEIRAMAEAVNARISASLGPEGVKDRVSDICQKVGETYRKRDWPVIAAFVDVAASMPGDRKAQETYTEDRLGPNIEAMLAGEAVGEECLYGEMAHRILATGRVTPNVMQDYRRGLYEGARAVWGDDAAAANIAAREAHHDRVGEDMDNRTARHLPSVVIKRFPGAAE